MSDQQPTHFSDHFSVSKAKLKELGVFDPILNFDTKVFVEPLLLKDSANLIIKKSYENYKQFFANLLLLLQKSTSTDDKCWRAAKRLVNFPEYQYTCIGYSSTNTAGLGSGIEFNDKILKSAKEIVDLAQGDPNIFLLLPLLEEGIAGDRISDMAQNIIDEDICQYTVSTMNQLSLKGDFRYVTRNNNAYDLLKNPYSKAPIKFIPSDILLNLPVADKVDSLVEEMAAYNQNLRDVINRDIGDIWFETTKAYRKHVLLDELKKNKAFFIETLKALKEYQFEHYDLDKDSEGLYKWLENSQDFINIELAKETKQCPNTPEGLSFAVYAIIKHFRDLIENQEIWRTFWTKVGDEYRHVRLYYSQMLFFTVCSTWLISQDSNIKVKLNQHHQHIALEFRVSNQHALLVHIRHANNAKLDKTYCSILEKAREAENNQYCIVIMNFKEEASKALKTVRTIKNPLCQLFEINVTHQSSTANENSAEQPDLGFLEFEDLKLTDDLYTQEKRRGGENSYQHYKPLRDKVTELCQAELASKQYTSANQLCLKVADILESEHPKLLASFAPYQQSKARGNDWKRPTFYGWCNELYKAYINTQELIPTD